MKKTLIFAISALLLSSCSFLEEKPTTSLTTSYGSEEALEADIRGIQRALEPVFVGDFLENGESCSGLVHFGATSARVEDSRWSCILSNFTYTSMSLNIAQYGNLYTAINRCNVLLAHIPDSPVNEAYKAEIAAEAKLYRALLYFFAVRLYGDVPLMLEPSETSFNPIPRTSYYLVYDQIVADLKDAFAGMRSADRVRAVTGTQGRPQKWAAKALLSTVYLQIASLLTVPEDENFYNPAKPGRKPVFTCDGIGTDKAKAWKLAYDTAKEVIESGQYRLAKNYSDLFQWRADFTDEYGRNAWNLDERIIVIQSTGNNTGNFSATRSLPSDPPGAQVPDGTSVSRSGNVRPSRFFFNEWGRRFAEDVDFRVDSVYRHSNDPRIDIALMHTSYVSCFTGATKNIYPYAKDDASLATGKSLPYFRKYLTPTYTGKPDVADFYVLRLAEIYYVAAEAAMQLNLGDAANYINEVHERSNTPDKASYTVDDILWDKLFELCGEGHSFCEVRRYGAKWFKENIIDARNTFFETMGGNGEEYVETYFGNNAFRYNLTMDQIRGALLFEFPKEELTANPAMSLADKNDYSRE